MRSVHQLSIAEMQSIISGIQAILWREFDPRGDVWNADKNWDIETLEHVAGTLEDHGLKPEEASPMWGALIWRVAR